MMRRRGTTLVEVLMATIVAALVAASTASLLTLIGGALREQDRLAAQLVRTAGGHARFADHVLRARAILLLTATQVVLWVPSEDFIASNEFKEAYDQINAREIRWYRWNSTSKQLELSRTLDANAAAVHPLATDWSALFTTLQSANQLQTIAVFDGLASVVFHHHGFNSCSTRRVSLDLTFDQAHGGQTLRLSEAVSFLQKHEDCP